MYSGSWKGTGATSTRNGPPFGSVNLVNGQNSSITRFIWSIEIISEGRTDYLQSQFKSLSKEP